VAKLFYWERTSPGPDPVVGRSVGSTAAAGAGACRSPSGPHASACTAGRTFDSKFSTCTFTGKVLSCVYRHEDL
jgi:hypothetical protein